MSANPGVRGAPGAPRRSPGSRARGRRAGPVTRRRKNASDPTWARFRDAGNIWGTFSPGVWESTSELGARASYDPDKPRPEGGWGREGTAVLPAASLLTGELTGGKRSGEGQIKHLEPGPRVLASLF